MKMNSLQLKTAILAHYRFRLRREYVCTEVGPWCADVCAANEKELHEIEVKVSMRDFRNDFFKRKHKVFNHEETSGWYYDIWKPNRFFYAITRRMLKQVEIELGDYPQYGIYVVEEPTGYHMDLKVTRIRAAKLLHSQAPRPKVYQMMLMRMSSELVGLHMKREAEDTAMKTLSKTIHEMQERSCLDGSTTFNTTPLIPKFRRRSKRK